MRNAGNHFNCPIVVSYAENLKNNVESIAEQGVRYLRPFLAFTSEATAARRLVEFCRERLSPERTMGFLMAPWGDCATPGELQNRILKSVDLLADAMDGTRS